MSVKEVVRVINSLKSRQTTPWTTRAHEAGMSRVIRNHGTQGVMWLARCLAAFDCLQCRCLSGLDGLVAHHKWQARTWIRADDFWPCSLVLV